MSKPRRSDLTMISFRADKELLEVIERLERGVDSGVMRRRRSIAIRRALIEADARFRGNKEPL